MSRSRHCGDGSPWVARCGSRSRAPVGRSTGTERERLAEAIAAKAATPEALAAFTEDLLTGYTSLMPANPRLIKRIANAFGMLLALGLHLGHHEDEDTVARAAILLIRFPSLVDDLLSAPDPPVLDPPANPSPAAPSPTDGSPAAPSPADSSPTDSSPSGPASPWLRRDVQQVLRRADGSRVDLTRLARCYGRYYGPDPVSSPAPQPTSAPSTSPPHRKITSD